MVELNLNSIRGFSTQLLNQYIYLTKAILDIPFFLWLQTQLSLLSKSLSTHPVVARIGFSEAHLFALALIVCSLAFVFFGRQIFRLAVFLLGFILSVFCTYFVLDLLQAHLPFHTSWNIAAAVLLSLFFGAFWSFLCFKAFPFAFYSLFLLAAASISYKISIAVASAAVEHFDLKHKSFNMFFLRVSESDGAQFPLLGMVAAHVFLALVAFALRAFHALLPLLLMALYAIGANGYFPFELPPTLDEFLRYARRSVDLHPVKMHTAIVLAALAILAFEVITLVRKTRFSALLGMVSAVIASFLAGAGAEILFRELNPEMHAQMSLSDQSLGFSVSLVSLLTTSLCVLAGLAVQLN